MRNDFFSVPFFTDKVDLEKITVIDESQQPTFRAGLMTSLRTNKQVSNETIEHLSEVISRNIDTLGVKYGSAKIDEIWRNTYTNQDFQDPHIHCYSQWSFIIYEDVDVSRTVFLNPYRFRVESQMAMYDEYFMMDYRPELHKGDIIIFPSFVEHYVLSGGTGTTIAGNVFLSPT
jgi:hypothetical protein|tara:strand:- start:45 stop:566 length:522 start_codon:yes stop_codon:yes gene_type:complete